MSASHSATMLPIRIGGVSIGVACEDASFLGMLEQRYRGFIAAEGTPDFELEVSLHEPVDVADADEDVRVARKGDDWILQRGDFRAIWSPAAAHGKVSQSNNPYAIDSVLRILHTLILASRGGFLVHAASAVKNGSAFLFAGVSGAGKTTISRLAPADTKLLTDEISYVRREGDGYIACGTPFAGELARPGENIEAPVKTLFLLEQAAENRITPIRPVEAARLLMRNILFFASDADLVAQVFQSACEFAEKVPVRRLSFLPDRRVWEMIG
ncbi:MAG TPA: hypothetical protein VF753_07115 [Terriglobales bacterium]